MSATVTRIHPDNIKDCTVPAAMAKIENAEASYVLTVTEGKWAFDSIISNKTHMELVGLLHCGCAKLEQEINA